MPSFPLTTDPNPFSTNPANVAGDVTQFSGQVESDFKSAFDLMPDLPTIRGPLRRLRKQYGKVDEAYDFTQTMKEGRAAQGASRDASVGAANAASQAYLAGSGGDNTAGAAVLRARALQPALKNDADTALTLAKMRDDAMKGALDAKVKIATTLGELKGNYINTLANYNSQRANNATAMMKFNALQKQLDLRNQPLPPIPPGQYFQGT